MHTGLSGDGVKFWAFVITALDNALTSVEKDKSEYRASVTDEAVKTRLARAVTGAEWASFYERPFQIHLIRALLTVSSFRVWKATLEPANFWGVFQAWFENREADLPAPPNDVRLAPKMFSAMHGLDGQIRAVMVYKRTMSDLIAEGRAGKDKAFFNAVRIDPAVLACKSLTARLHVAVAANDKRFLRDLAVAMENPVRVETLDFSRLHAALFLLGIAGQLPKLTQKTAAELFITRTRLYRKHGAEDAERSLWRFIQRWKREHATRLAKKMSSPA